MPTYKTQARTQRVHKKPAKTPRRTQRVHKKPAKTTRESRLTRTFAPKSLLPMLMVYMNVQDLSNLCLVEWKWFYATEEIFRVRGRTSIRSVPLLLSMARQGLSQLICTQKLVTQVKNKSFHSLRVVPKYDLYTDGKRFYEELHYYVYLGVSGPF